MQPNEDLLREQVEGVRRDKKGNRLPTPFYCALCRQDANYGFDEVWYCTTHWQRTPHWRNRVAGIQVTGKFTEKEQK